MQGSIVDERLERIFPGMGLRPLGMTLLSAFALILYFHEGALRATPRWWIQGSREVFGVPDSDFHRHLWSHSWAVLLLMIVPLVVSRFASGWGPRDLGFRVKGAHREVLVVLALWLAFVPVVVLIANTPSFAAKYPRVKAISGDGTLFILFHAFYLMKWIAWEFFFRGYMLFGFEKDFGARAVLISTVPFALMHVGKPQLEMLAAVPAGFILCYIALRSRSIWPGVLLHWLVATTLDFTVSTWWQGG